MDPNCVDIESDDEQYAIRRPEDAAETTSKKKKKSKIETKRGPLRVTNPDLKSASSPNGGLDEPFVLGDLSIPKTPTISVRPSTPTKNESVDESDDNSITSISTSSSDMTLSHQEYATTSKPTLDRSSSGRSADSMIVSGQYGLGTLRLREDILKDEEKKQMKRARSKLARENIANKAAQEIFNRLPDESNFLKSGDTLIFSEFPKNLIIALDASDYIDFDPSNLAGIKSIPPGTHLLYGGLGGNEIISGIWFISGEKYKKSAVGEVVVKKWSVYDELIVEEVSRAETMIQGDEIIHDMDRQEKLLHYSFFATVNGEPITFQGAPEESTDHDIWYCLSHAITGAALNRITDNDWNCWKVNSADGFDCDPIKGIGASLQKVKTLFFIFERDNGIFSADITGPERTKENVDSSQYIRDLIKTRCPRQNPNEIIADIQFTYITGMLVGSRRCMQQWGLMMKVIFKAHKLAIEDPDFFTLILSTVHAQLTHDLSRTPSHGSIFHHDAMLKAEVKVSLIIFKSHLNEYFLERGNMPHGLSPTHAKLAETWKAFEQYLWSSDWQWDLRGTYLRDGKVVLEDGEQVEWSKKELEDMANDDDDSDDDADDEDDKKSFLQKNRKKASKFFKKAKRAFNTSPRKSGGR